MAVLSPPSPVECKIGSPSRRPLAVVFTLASTPFAEAMAAAIEEMKEAEAEELAAAHQEDQAPDSDAPFHDGELRDNDSPGDFPPSETGP